MKKRIKIICGFLLIIVMALGFVLNKCTNTSHYEKSKEEATHFLAKNEADLKDIFEDLMSKEQNDSGKYKGKFYIYYKTDSTEYVKLDIDARGMLGGQYWGIIYCPNNNLIRNNSSVEIYDESKNGTGNNIFIKEKIKDNWYFYYDDYDGKVDITKIYID